jgi:hypothetical protein
VRFCERERERERSLQFERKKIAKRLAKGFRRETKKPEKVFLSLS